MDYGKKCSYATLKVRLLSRNLMILPSHDKFAKVQFLPIPGRLGISSQANDQTANPLEISPPPATVQRMLNFDLDINACWQVQSHQHINRFGIRINHINQAIVRADLKMLL